MIFADKLTLDAPRRLDGGYMVVRAKAARSGVYQYAGSEVDPANAHGLRDQAIVNVLREPEVVFDRKAVHSFIGKPITDNHPAVAVDASNWRDHARGVVMGAMKDGEHLSFDLLLTDQSAIAAVDGGKRELSNGYAADLEFGDYVAPDGTACQARQTSIKGNHVALVDRGRAGSECRIADAKPCVSLPADVFELLTDSAPYGDVEYADPGYQSDSKKRYPIDTEEHIRAAWNYIHKKENADKYSSADLAKVKAKIVAAWKAKIDKDGPPSATGDERTYSGDSNANKNQPSNNGDGRMPHTLIIDGLQVADVSDQAKAAIEKLQGQIAALTTAKDAAETKVGELTAEVSTKDGQIAALTQKVKDAELSPAQLEKLVADRSQLIAQAKAVAPNIVTDGKTEAEIRNAVVEAKLGDVAKSLDDKAIEGAFAVLVMKADPVRAQLSGATPVLHDVDDARAKYEKARDKAKQSIADAWKGEPAKAA